MSHRLFGRRTFTSAAGAWALTGLCSPLARAAAPAAKPTTAASKFPIAFGYTAMTWGRVGIEQAVAEIAEAGFHGVQTRLDVVKELPKPEVLRELLAKHKLTFVCLSGGNPKPDPKERKAEVDKFMEGARYAKAAGALCIQALGTSRPETGVDKEMLKNFAATLDEVGKQTADLGLPLSFHHHMGLLGQGQDEVDQLLASTNPKYVNLLLDTGHCLAAGGDPAKAIKKYGKRINLLHIKDYSEKVPPGMKSKMGNFAFVELGDGKVDFPSVFAALKSIDYKGWAVVELDKPQTGREPKAAALANHAYLEKTLSITI